MENVGAVKELCKLTVCVCLCVVENMPNDIFMYAINTKIQQCT